MGKNIIVACDTLEVGGAETFAMRMAKYYRERGHNVYLATVLPDKINIDLVKVNAGDVEVIAYDPGKLTNWAIYKADGLRHRLADYKSVRRKLTIDYFKKFINDHNIQVVHTNMFAALDIFNHAVIDNPSVITIHSVHADIVGFAHLELKHPEKLSAYERYTLKTHLPAILKRVNHIVATAEMHLKIFGAWNKFPLSKLHKIYNPVEVNKNTDKISRGELNIPQDAFVFGTMGRCIEPKGWKQLIPAFIQSRIKNSFLLLIGDGPILSELKQQYQEYSNIIFLGRQSNPLRYIRLFDVGISPSWFWESLPTAIIDYMSVNKPVIVTDNAESKYMISSEAGTAGLVVPLQKDEYDVIEGADPLKEKDLCEAMIKIYEDKNLYQRLQANTVTCYNQFNKDLIVTQYEKLFL